MHLNLSHVLNFKVARKMRLNYWVYAGVVLFLLPASALADDLLSLHQQAIQHDPELGQAQIALNIAKEGKIQSRSQLLPSINFSANTTYNVQNGKVGQFNAVDIVTDDRYNSHGYSLNLTQPIYRHNAWVQYRQSSIQIQQTETALRGAEQALIIRLATRYFDVLAAQDFLRFSQSEEQALELQLKQTKQRFEVGLIAITDVHEAQAGFDIAVTQTIIAENALTLSFDALQEITDQPQTKLAKLDPTAKQVEPTPSNAHQWVEQALQQNLQLESTKLQNKRLRQEVKRLRGGHYPTLDIVANHSKSVAAGGGFGSSDIDNTSVGLVLNVPIYLGGAISSQTRQAHDQLEQNRQLLKQQQRAVKRQTRQAYLGVISNISQTTALAQAVISNQSALQAIKTGLEVGTRTTVDLLQATKKLYRAQYDLSRSRYDYIINTLRLKQATGSLSPSDLEQINHWFL